MDCRGYGGSVVMVWCAGVVVWCGGLCGVVCCGSGELGLWCGCGYIVTVDWL